MARLLVFLVILLSSWNASAAVLFYDDCEDTPNTSADWVLSGVGPSVPLDQSQILVSTEQARAGSSSYKFILPPYGTDGTSSPSKRTELRLAGLASSENINNFTVGSEYWIGYSVYFPADFVFPEDGEPGDWGLTGQFHSVDDACDVMITNPTCALYYDKPGMQLAIRADDAECSTTTLDRNTAISGIPINLGAWNDFVINVQWGYSLAHNPKFKLWVNGVLEVDDTGVNCWNDSKGPYWKIGLYAIQREWMVIYLDEVRVGNGSASYADVAPSGNTSAPTPLTISTSSLGSWTQGIEASGTLAATGGITPYTWSSADKPSWFTLTAATGAWSASPTAGGTYTFTITCTDADSNAIHKVFSGTITEVSAPTLPKVTAFVMPDTSTTLEVPVTTFTGDAGTAAYIVTESPAKPVVSDPGWVASAPTSATASGDGMVYFYGYVKDGDGVISVGDVEAVDITIDDSVITGWTETATANVWSASCGITALSVSFDSAQGNKKSILDDVSTALDWFYASGTLYTYSTTDPDTAYTTITASTDVTPAPVTPAEGVITTGGNKTITTTGEKVLGVR